MDSNLLHIMYQIASVFIVPCLPFSGDKVSAEAAGWLPPGVLTYFLDGILPLLWVGAADSI